MCTRFFIEPNSENLQEIIEEAMKSGLNRIFIKENKYLISEGEVRPTDVVPVIASDSRLNRAVFPMRWGFQITDGPLLVNARSETASTKISFKESFIRRRCIIPASYYFEWEHYTDEKGKKRTGDKFRIKPTNNEITFICGLYRINNGLPEFTVLTRSPGEAVAKIHDRMPVILPEEKINDWINPGKNAEQCLAYSLTKMNLEKVTEKK